MSYTELIVKIKKSKVVITMEEIIIGYPVQCIVLQDAMTAQWMRICPLCANEVERKMVLAA